MQTGSKILFILVFVSVVTSKYAYSQKVPVVKDSTKVYKSIESFSVKRKFTKFMYQMLFKPVAIKSQKKNGRNTGKLTRHTPGKMTSRAMKRM